MVQQATILESLTAARSYPVVQAVVDETEKQVKLYENSADDKESKPEEIYDIVVAKMVSSLSTHGAH